MFSTCRTPSEILRRLKDLGYVLRYLHVADLETGRKYVFQREAGRDIDLFSNIDAETVLAHVNTLTPTVRAAYAVGDNVWYMSLYYTTMNLTGEEENIVKVLQVEYYILVACRSLCYHEPDILLVAVFEREKNIHTTLISKTLHRLRLLYLLYLTHREYFENAISTVQKTGMAVKIFDMYRIGRTSRCVVIEAEDSRDRVYLCSEGVKIIVDVCGRPVPLYETHVRDLAHVFKHIL